MADLSDFDFRVDEVEIDDEFELLPVGTYPAQIAGSERREKENGDVMVTLVFEITGGDHEGRKIWHNLNLRHSNPTAQKIAQQDLAKICLAVNVLQPQTTDDLEFRPMQITIKHRKRKDTGEMQAAIAKFEPAAATKQRAPTQAKTASPAASSDRLPPWKRGK